MEKYNPSTCVQFKPLSDDFALDEQAPGFRVLHLKQRVQTKFIVPKGAKKLIPKFGYSFLWFFSITLWLQNKA